LRAATLAVTCGLVVTRSDFDEVDVECWTKKPDETDCKRVPSTTQRPRSVCLLSVLWWRHVNCVLHDTETEVCLSATVNYCGLLSILKYYS